MIELGIDNLGLGAREKVRLLDEHGALADWLAAAAGQWSEHTLGRRYGDYPRWRQLLAALPRLEQPRYELADGVSITGERAFGEEEREIYMGLHPWRKGPFSICGMEIDSEWRSQMKWQRLGACLGNVAGERILDIGAGNGYYAFRLCAHQPRLIACLEPTGLYWAQYMSVRAYLKELPIVFMPLGLERFDAPVEFDLALSLGVIYHSREPADHLARIKRLLRPGGRLVLESLVVGEDDTDLTLAGKQRYAMMRNVWNVPRPTRLIEWLREAGFVRARIVDISATTAAEQRQTPWMRFHSLGHFLDPDDASKTVEGYPAPRRALIEAFAPDG